MSENKPPLGVKPLWMIAEARVKELSEAITRMCVDGMQKYKNNRAVKGYAEEIIKFCDLGVWSTLSEDQDGEELPFD